MFDIVLFGLSGERQEEIVKMFTDGGVGVRVYERPPRTEFGDLTNEFLREMSTALGVFFLDGVTLNIDRILDCIYLSFAIKDTLLVIWSAVAENCATIQRVDLILEANQTEVRSGPCEEYLKRQTEAGWQNKPS